MATILPGLQHLRPSRFRVSTITATGGVNTSIDLDKLFCNVRIADVSHENSRVFSHITYMHLRTRAAEQDDVLHAPHLEKHADNVTRYAFEDGPDVQPGPVLVTFSRGVKPCSAKGKSTKTTRKRRNNRAFDNQATVIFSFLPAGPPHLPLNLNMKVFKNGIVQITGIKEPHQGRFAIDHLIAELRRIHKECDGDVVSEVDHLQSVNYQICLVNSDFNLGVEIRRNVLQDLIAQHDIRSTFEPCIYPGVKIDYLYNEGDSAGACGERRCFARGACRCTTLCTGKGRGGGNGDCRKVTIAVFQSGCVIITGAHTLEQVQCAYDYITTFIDEHHDYVRKPLTGIVP